jgi:putative ABC transport system permease protein
MIFVRNLARAWGRSLMTVAGIACGVALFAAISAITRDLQSQIDGAAGQYRLELVISERRATSPMSSRLSAATIDALAARYGEHLAPLVFGTLNERWNPYALVVGAQPRFIERVPVVEGRRPPPGQPALMLGEIAAQRLALAPGAELELAGRRLAVHGVFRTGSRLFDGGLMGEIGPVQRLYAQDGGPLSYTLALVSTGDRAATARIIDEVGRDFPSLKAIPGTEFAGAVRLLRLVVDAFVGTIAVVVLLGTGLVVVNMLTMALAERTREIGILMAIGWTPWRVLRLLAAETALLCGVGALLGNGFGLALLHGVNRLETVGFGWLPLHLGTAQVLTSFTLVFGVGTLSLAWPALVLWRMQPLEALRHE